MKVVLLSIIAALVATANVASASDSLRSRSSVIIDNSQPTADGLDSLEDVMVAMLRGAIENEDPDQLFGGELWDGLKEKVCINFKIEKDEEEEEKALAGKFLLLFELKKLLCNNDDGITTSTTSSTTSGETCGKSGDACPGPTGFGQQSTCCDGRFVFFC